MKSESFSSSFSSETGEDGKKHENKSQSGQQEVCSNGKCKVVLCKDGVCREMNEDLSKEKVPHEAHMQPN